MNFKEKQTLTIYTDDNELMYIKFSVACTLGLVSSEEVMQTEEDCLISFSEKQLSILLNKENLDIEFIDLGEKIGSR